MTREEKSKLLNELLEYEEKNDIGFLTRAERREFQQWISKALEQESKTGHWIIIDDCELFMAKCSECGEIVDSRMISKYPYCHCGAKMVESQESEG